jgi:hypothetical protein
MMHGEFEANQKIEELQRFGLDQEMQEDREKVDAKAISESNNFLTKLMNKNPSPPTMENNAPIGSIPQ